MKYTFIVILIFVFNQVARSQFSNNLILKEKFSYEIIQIEEFIERFNFKEDTKLLNYLKINQPYFNIERKKFLTTLFNTYDTTFNMPFVKAFVNYVNNSVNPQYLNFYDNDWYAEVSCVFKYESRIDTGKLILKNQFKIDSSSKWVIAGVSSKILEFPESKDTLRILSPVSHGTDFIALYDIFEDGENIQNYIIKDFKLDTLTYLITLIYFNKIEITQLLNVKYHFLQIPKWIFTVEYFNRKDLNSGWLISDLLRMSWEEKENYKIKFLNIY